MNFLEKTSSNETVRFILVSAALVCILLAIESCREVIDYKGKFRINSREIDNSLADSVLIYGKVVSAIDTLSPMADARIWVDKLSKSTQSNLNGLYILKIPAGIFTIYCKEDFGADEFTESIKDLTLLPNEKVEIDFYLGGRVE
ncbi:hypothetical protein [Pontibacter virosus]|uniref:Carboxypeptidase regulatory-like domain-containing protein n=1 Tax=Pontibacter virosus TaxID=1765052 RepID=A0A2U1AXG2_9BACT|nr:hypothetical protein [Pontibacter virosus]PVY41115.1 hypothetical protein C8E01_10540 [Pontibacter virosus]